MKRFFIFCFTIFSYAFSFGQNIAINNDGSSAENSAMLDVSSKTKGMLLPRLTSIQRNAIPSPANGLMVYDTDTRNIWVYKGIVGWTEVSPFNIPYSKAVNMAFNAAIDITNSSNFFNSTAIRGNSGHTGIWGSGTAATARGIFGEGVIANAVGVWGKSYETTTYPAIDYNTAVVGQAAANIGVAGYASTGIAIKGKATGAGGRGGYFEGQTGAQALLVNGDSQLDGNVEINGVTHADGGLAINGDLTLLGNPGTARQVLTSNGTGTPSWRNAAFSNNTRFQFFGGSSTQSGGFTYSTYYNLTPADISISGSSITIHKTGLYHLEIYMKSEIDLSAAPSIPPRFDLDVLNRSLIFNKPMYLGGFSSRYRIGENFTIEQHLTAGQIITPAFNAFISGATVNFINSSIIFTGHLVSE